MNSDFWTCCHNALPVAFAQLREAAVNNGNVFEALMDAVRACSLG